MLRFAQLAIRQAPAAAALTQHAARATSTSAPPSSFNPEAYLRFPQFLHDINSKLMLYKSMQDTQGLLHKGGLVYANKFVTLEGSLSIVSSLSERDRTALKQLSIACKGLFWQSDIDYTCVPCLFPMTADFTPANFLDELGLGTPSFHDSVKCTYFAGGTLHHLPIISYQGEDAMNVYRAPVDIISSIFSDYDEAYHVTVGEGVINPILHFIVAKCESGKLIGIMSASVEE